MPWCPKCKTEYEEHMTRCVDCDVDLVDQEALETHIDYELLGYVPESELRDILEYLDYSSISPIKQEKDERGIGLYVDAKQHKEAYKFLSVYIHERVEEDEDDDEFELPEYDTIDLTEGRMTKELKSSAFSFTFIGSIMLIFGLLHVFNLLNVLHSNMYNYVISGLGLIFLLVGIVTYKKIPSAMKEEEENFNKIDTYVEWFESQYDRDSYIEKQGINIDDYDEGSLYFVVVDLLKKDIEAAFPSEDKVLINSGCESICEKYFT